MVVREPLKYGERYLNRLVIYQIRQNRSKDDKYDHKKSDALYHIATIKHSESALKWRLEKQDTLLDMVNAINKKLKQKALDQQALKEIEQESKHSGAYSIVKSLDRKSTVSEKLGEMHSENRK